MSSERSEKGMAISGYPFGREEEVSTKQLLQFFCNCIYLGQWELAVACIPQLHAAQNTLQVTCDYILKEAARNSYGFSLGSRSLDSPHHLSWLCSQQLQKIQSEPTNDRQGNLGSDLTDEGFRLLLTQAYNQSNIKVLQELYGQYQVLASLGGTLSTHETTYVPGLSTQCQEFLLETLRQSPVLGAALLHALQGPSNQSLGSADSASSAESWIPQCRSVSPSYYSAAARERTPSPLVGSSSRSVSGSPSVVSSSASPATSASDSSFKGQGKYGGSPSQLSLPRYQQWICSVYVRCLSQILSDLRKASYYPPTNQTHLQQLIDTFCQLLSLYNPVPGLTLSLKTFWLDLWDLLHKPGAVPIKPNMVYSSLLAQPGHHRLHEFCLAEKEYQKSHRPQDLQTIISIVELLPWQQDLLSAILIPDRQSVWKDLYFFSLKNKKHFLDAILETSVNIIQQGALEVVGRMLDGPNWQNLRPLVLLAGWDHCMDLDFARQLLDALEVDRVAGPSHLMEACQQLHYHVNLVHFCLDKASSLMDEYDSSGYHQKIRTMLHGQQTQSVLDLLHRCTNLALLNPQEVFDIIAKRPHPSNDGDKSPKKSVRFAMDERDVAENLVNTRSVNVSGESDRMIYTSYLAIKYAMDALHFCANTCDVAHVEQVNEKTAQYSSQTSFPRGASPPEKSTCVSESTGFTVRYKQFVTDNLEMCKSYISQVYPLEFRIEILENIFSLLFVTNDDIQETSLSALSDSGEEGLTESRTGSRIGSQENLTLLDTPNTTLTGGGSVSELRTLEENVDSLDNVCPGEPPQEAGYSETKQLIQDDVVSPPQSNIKSTVETHYSGIFSISKTELKDLSSGLEGRKYGSGGHSTHSTCSVGSTYQVGFVANEYIVRDLLAMLRDCLVDLSAAKFSQLGQSQDIAGPDSIVGSQHPLQGVLHTSVDAASQQQRVSNLSQCLSEATWRFQLVATTKLSQQPGQVPGDLADDVASDDNADLDARSRIGRKRKRKTVYGEEYSVSGISAMESESHAATTGTEDSVCSSGSPMTKGRYHHSSRGTMVWLLHGKYGVVSRMLADHQSLLHTCLLNCRYTQADQVVKMFNLQGEMGASEVVFAEKFQSAVKKLQSLESRGRTSLGQSVKQRVGVKTKKPSMSVLAKVAAVGVASVSSSSTVDQILGLSVLPQFSQELVDSLQYLASPLTNHINTGHIPAMVALDLACAGCRSLESSMNVLSVARSRLPGHKGELSPVTPLVEQMKPMSSPLRGVPWLLSILHELAHMSSQEVGPDVVARYLTLGTNQALLTSTMPLLVSELKIHVAALQEIQRSLARLEKAQIEVSRTRSLGRSISSPDDPVKTVPGAKSTSPRIRVAFKHLIDGLRKYLPVEGLTGHLLRGLETSPGSWNQYLQMLYDHVKVLAGLVAQCDQPQQDAASIEYFKVLDESPTQILGKLIFVQQMLPSRLESVADRLHVNLTKVIVHNCCHSLPLCYQPSSGLVAHVGSRQVLNAGPGKFGSGRHPEMVVRGLLTRLLQAVKKHASAENASGVLVLETASSFAQMEEFDAIETATQELQYLDLKLLTDKNQKLCFFGNLCNLLTLHVYLKRLQPKQTQLNDLQHQTSHSRKASLQLDTTLDDNILPTSVIEWQLLQDRMAYLIGQLGVISLLELRQLVLSNSLPPAPNMTTGEHVQLDKNDVWSVLGPPPEPTMMFVLSEGQLSSPPIQVLSPEILQNQLYSAAHEFLNHTVSVDIGTFKVLVPELIVNCCRHLVISEDVSHQKEALVAFIASCVSGELESHLQFVLQKKREEKAMGSSIEFQLEVLPPNIGFAFTFSYDQLCECLPLPRKPHKRRASLPNKGHLSIVRSLSMSSGDERRFSRQVSWIGRSKFSLTPTTLDYLRSKFPLVAMLSSAISNAADDSIQRQLHESFFPMMTPTSDQPSETNVQLHWYQNALSYSPALLRHVTYWVLPIEVANNPKLAEAREILKELAVEGLSPEGRTCFLEPPGAGKYENTLLELICYLLDVQDWQSAVQLLNSLSDYCLLVCPSLRCFRDLILCWAVGKVGHKNSTENTDNWRLLLQGKGENKVRVILGSLQSWNADVCITLLRVCSGIPLLSPNLKTIVCERLQAMITYQRVTECAENKMVKLNLKEQVNSASSILSSSVGSDSSDHGLTLGLDTKRHRLEGLKHWQAVVVESHNDPNHILDILLDSHEYHTARHWVTLHDTSKTLHQIIEEKYLHFLLEKDSPDYIKSFQILEEVCKTDRTVCVGLCENLMPCLNFHNNKLFLARFMINHLTSHISQPRLEELQLLCMGCKALQFLPDKAQSMCCHLVSKPLVLLEQLLMNSKIEWAGLVLKSFRRDIILLGDDKCGIDDSSCNDLLVKYSTKALEFPVILAETPESLSRSQSRMSIASSTSQMPSMQRRQTVAGLGGLILPSHLPRSQSYGIGNRTRNASISLASPAKLLMQQTGSLPSMDPGHLRGKTPSPSPYSPSSSQMQARNNDVIAPFVMPSSPPTKDQWVPDSAVINCMVCKDERFSMFNRRHHCRRCGRVVCAACSSKTTIVRGTSARTCDDCFTQSFKPKDSEDQSKMKKLQERLSGGSTGSPLVVGSQSSQPGFEQAEIGFAASLEYQYLLTLDPEMNDATREEFYYDQAPSTTLCLSILELHSKAGECGAVILRLCDDVSCMLQPLAPGVRNPEVDYGFIISMLRYLLLNAKVRLVSAGDPSGVARCEQYQSKVDLLDVLVSANCAYIPSIQQLTKMDILRRLRDKLIENERLQLAMEVSTKCGIDPTGVWAAWGMACLRASDFPAARDKFSRCLKTPVDRNQMLSPSKLLQDILGHLETTFASSGESLLAPLKSVKDLLAEPPPIQPESSGLEEPAMVECLHYLQTYGTYHGLVSFYRRRGLYSKAAQFIIDKHCSAEVFVEGLLVPSLTSGSIGKLYDTLAGLHPNLERWTPYLTATCKHLNRNRLYHSLYQTQVFMKDYIRAAMTCIQCFYQRGATSYNDLFSRMPHLLSAKQHLEAYLDEKQWGATSRHRRTTALAETTVTRMIMTPGEINKYINTINLQIDVTKFLQRYQDNLDSVTSRQKGGIDHEGAATGTGHGSVASSSSLTSDVPPTLFGSTKMKAQVSNLLLLSGNNVHDGFGLAFRIIQDFKLDSTYIYVQAGQFFARQHRYNYVNQLLQCVRESGLCTDISFDEVLGSSIEVVANQPSEGRDVENLIKQIRSDVNKINAYILCGKLKSAYLVAVKTGREEDIIRISNAAERAGQMAVKSICDKWLQQHQK